jgi:hypothetical protein
MDPTFGIMMYGPSCLAILDPHTGVPLKVNHTFEQHMGPLYKFTTTITGMNVGNKAAATANTTAAGTGTHFYKAASEDDDGKHQNALKAVMDEIMHPSQSTKTKATARNVEMVTLAGESGFPIKRHFDWTVGKTTLGPNGATIFLVGELVTEQSVEEHEHDQGA